MLQENLSFDIKKNVKDKENNKNKKGFFNLDFNNTTIKKEFIGGLSTFLAMVYILAVEPSILGKSDNLVNDPKISVGGLFVATVLVTMISTLLMGLCSNIPVAVAPSMGMNTMFVFSVANKGLGYEGGFICVWISSIIFCILSITNLRSYIIRALPGSFHLAIGVGIGFFIAYVGLSEMNVVQTNDGLPSAALGNFKKYYVGIIVGTLVLFGGIFLYYKKFIAPIAITILAGFIISVILSNALTNSEDVQNSFGSSKWNGWSYQDYSGFVKNIKYSFMAFVDRSIWTNSTMYVSLLVFTLVCFFDATGTLTAINVILDEQSNKKYLLPKSSLIIDSASSIGGGILGLSHLNCYVESSVGIAQGARTGLASVFTAGFFALNFALYPIFKMIPECISGAATVFIGTIMIQSVAKIDWKKPEISLASFFCILFMIITYSISNGIAVGVIAYTVGCLATKKYKLVTPIIWVLDLLFLAYFVSTAFI